MLWVISGHLQCKTACPLYSRKRTLTAHRSMSALGQKRTLALQQTSILFDHLAGAERQSWRDVQSDHIGGLEGDYQLVFGRCLTREFARLLAPQNAIGIGCSPSPLIDLIRPIGHQPALGCEISERIERRAAGARPR